MQIASSGFDFKSSHYIYKIETLRQSFKSIYQSTRFPFLDRTKNILILIYYDKGFMVYRIVNDFLLQQI